MIEEDIELDDIAEEAIQRKRNVKDILVEMKDTSELMVDLAYSALLTNSQDIAEEVEDLEELMDNLQYEISIMSMLAARTPEEAADLSGILQVARSAESISDSAGDIVDVVLRGVGDHPIYQTLMDEAEERVQKIRLTETCSLNGTTIGDFRVFTETGSYIRAIKRAGKWIYNPKKGTRLLKDDLLIVTGMHDSIEKMQKLCTGD